MKLLFCIIGLFVSQEIIASDLTIGSVITSPVSGCNLTANEIVKITIINNDIAAYSGTFDVSYTVNSVTVTETVTVPVLPTSATYIYEFTATVDLSACAIHVITLTVFDPTDVNPSNNSISVSITNDCAPVAGSISGPTNVCETGNSGQIEIQGNTGIITDWAFSDDSGASFSSTGNTSNIQLYNNISTNRIYRIYYDSQHGLCPSDSLDYLITVDAASNAGILSNDSTHCDTILPTNLQLAGYNGDIINYQLSVNGGASYTTYTNTADTLEYTQFGNSFQFFAITQNGTCIADSSNIVLIDITPGADAGQIVGMDTLCAGESTTDLDVINFDGSILDWEYSQDNGITWISIGLTTSSISLSNITTDAIVRVFVEKQPCGIDTADISIVVLPASDAGTVTGANTFCDIINTGAVNTSNINGNVTGWLSTIDGGSTFTSISNTSTNLIYNNITTTTGFAVIALVDGCEPDTSNFVNIEIINGTVAGNILVADSICSAPQGVELTLVGNEGDVIAWEYSTDGGANWVTTGGTDITLNQTSVTGNLDFRVIVENAPCEADTAFASTYIFEPSATFALEDTINLGDSIQLQANAGLSYEWTPNIYISNNLIENPKVSPPVNTLFEVTVIDSNGCPAVSSHRIVILEEVAEEAVLKINNFISPNGDGYNDTWLIKDIELFPTNSVTVFNSYGQVIFSASPYLNNWDVAADNLPNGTYFYVLQTAPNEPQTKGTLTIID